MNRQKFEDLTDSDRKKVLAELHQLRRDKTPSPPVHDAICAAIRTLEDAHEERKVQERVRVVQAPPPPPTERVVTMPPRAESSMSGWHSYCPKPDVCECECLGCKRSWWDAGRPKPPTGMRRDFVH